MVGAMKARRRFDAPTDPAVVEAHAENLTGKHLAVLRARAADKTYEQIAGELDLRLGTVRSRLNRARNALDMLIEQADDGRREKRELEPGGLLSDE